MRQVVAAEFLSLDGVMQDPAWAVPYWNNEIAKFKRDEHFASDALLLGRVTYEGFAQAWPSRTDEDGYADRMNSFPKYVVSTTLTSTTWNNSHLIKANIAQEVSRLKQQSGQDLLIFGSGKLVHTLIQHHLVDEFRLLVYPIILGKGQRLLNDEIETKLRLVESQTFSSGVVALIYQTEE